MSANDPSSDTNAILAAARTCLALGFSVVPLRNNEKRAAVRWQAYQERLPTDDELVDWFSTQGYTGYAVITGSVSRLLVLDFDNPALYHAFRVAYPKLANTLIICTRRGFHLYYRVPANADLKTRKLDDIDIQYEGRYVVGSRTTIDGHTYHVSGTPRMPKTLGEDGLSHLQEWIDDYTQPTPATPKPSTTYDEKHIPDEIYAGMELDDLTATALYYKRAIKKNRNNALFEVACLCRDAGWWPDKTLSILGPVHVHQSAPPGHRAENKRRRYIEAENTIASAYSRPRRRVQRKERRPASYLPNAVREQLNRLKLTAVLRVLEGLALVGVTPGTLICYSDALELLSPLGIGNHSIRKALNAVLDDDKDIIYEATEEQMEGASRIVPPPTTPQDANAAAEGTVTLTPNALWSGDKNRQKPSGRPPKYFVIPSAAELCERLGVKSKGSDAVHAEDLKGVVAYRSRLHRCLIERRPGQYSRRLLADRLGVGIQTVRTYDVIQKIKVLPIVSYTQLFWHNLTRYVPRQLDELPGGVFLHCDRVDYPLKYEIAQKLLRAEKSVYFAQQETNFYTTEEKLYSAVPLEMMITRQPVKSGADTAAMAAYHDRLARSASLDAKPHEPAKPTTSKAHESHTPPKLRGVKLTVPPNPRYSSDDVPRTRTYSPQQIETWVERVYVWINRQAGDQAAKKVSRATLRGLVADYGLEGLRQGFAVMQKRTGIENPAGWLRVFMRSEATARRKAKGK